MGYGHTAVARSLKRIGARLSLYQRANLNKHITPPPDGRQKKSDAFARVPTLKGTNVVNIVAATMTEMRSIPSGGVGVFATRKYATGDVILDESAPILRLAPLSDKDRRTLLASLPPVSTSSSRKSESGDHDPVSFLWSITPPSSISKEYVGKFMGMIQAVSCFAEFDHCAEASSKMFELYAPDPDAPVADEEVIVKVAKAALRYIQNHSKGESKLRLFATQNPDLALKVMLLWSCNSFEGGRIYEKQSRINHSCNPNSIIQADGDVQLVRASTVIHPGDEITTSYLGLLLYTDRPTRRSLLASNKHFHCSCERCNYSQASDPAAAIPCIVCHPRDGRYLEEDVAYDDDKQVKYMYPRGSEDYECIACTTKIPNNGSESTGSSDPISVATIVSQKVLAFLLEKETRVEDDDEADEEWEEQMNQLTCSVAGALHWTTNLVTLMRLNRLLKRQHAAMLQTGENPEPEEIAEAIDMLERLCRFMRGLELNLHIGHVLSTVIIGVARTLVSLGDEKSKRYAADWISQVKDFSDVFDSAGIQKVVKSLLEAGESGASEPVTKKAKAK